MQLFVDTNYNFLKYRHYFLIFSLIVAIAGAGLFIGRGVNLGIDFAGGASVVLRFDAAPPIDQLRSIVADASIQRYGTTDDNSVLLRLPEKGVEGDYAGEVVQRLHEAFNTDAGNRVDLNSQGTGSLTDMLAAADPDGRGSGIDARAYYEGIARSIISARSDVDIFHAMTEATSAEGVTPAAASVLEEMTYLGKFNVLSQETVGPQIGKELQKKAFLAIILSTLAMGVYIGIRFDLKFAVAAILCLAHDVLMTFAFMLLINAEFEIITVAAYLMIVGYSINDTVVVYDRVRENVRKLRTKLGFEDVINLSLNQTLSRTILTSGSTIIILICLIIWGGEVINEFSWLLLVGILFGTYSSLAIVPSIVLAWNRFISKEPSRVGGKVVSKSA